jgi:hypothetical protein
MSISPGCVFGEFRDDGIQDIDDRSADSQDRKSKGDRDKWMDDRLEP